MNRLAAFVTAVVMVAVPQTATVGSAQAAGPVQAPVASQGTPVPAPQAPPPQTGQAPVFRAGVTLVPLDVRVVDKNGTPVTDLAAADFTILEDGVPQRLGHFSTHAYTAEPASTSIGRPRRASDAMELGGADNRRTFLIVLGRGILTGPSEGVDGMLHLVNDRLLPQDLVAVLAWNRSTDFTTDRKGVTDVLTRFKKAHIGIDLAIRQWVGSLERIYGDGRLPARIQKQIDNVFGGAREGRSMDMSLSATDKLDDQLRRIGDRQLGGDLSGNKLDPIDQAEFDRLGGDLDAFMQGASQTFQDLQSLYMGVEFLRHLAGEKHLIFLSAGGIVPPSMDDDRAIARRAADARVTMSIIDLGGGGILAGQVARSITRMTGSQYFAHRFKRASMDVDRIDQATRFAYSLGYYPDKPIGDGRYRRVSVRVNRPGLTVLSRDGYFARREIGPFERKGMMVFTRVSAAAGFPRPIGDVAISRASAVRKGREANAPIVVSVTIDLSRVAFDRKAGPGTAGLSTSEIEVAAFAVTRNQKTVGDSWQTLQLSYTDDRLEAARRNGITHQLTLAANGDVREVKVVVYNYAADLAGTIVIKVER
jgi:VWFA-related protein